MPIYEFIATLDRTLTDEDYDQLFDAGLDDTTPATEHGIGVLMVTRNAESLIAAIVSVVEDARKAGFVVTGMKDEDLVSLKTIAARLGRSYESLRLLASGKRGPGGFPPPLSADGWSLYSWAAVSKWLNANNYASLDPASIDHLALVAADHLLQARSLVDAHTLERLAPLTAA
ncbi:hypothetical protein [Subtercola endophyticus]|uniref:hypothetical protein n=1 Tax=Subtercola endophyticus TaxID=2895559 RepID=UPI001E5F3E33|nr:hypothetical protein [Subtercola endophyticus]UFS57615.1 hypothetical protein LQ955_11140 [Subtercola endophyticus]